LVASPSRSAGEVQSTTISGAEVIPGANNEPLSVPGSRVATSRNALRMTYREKSFVLKQFVEHHVPEKNGVALTAAYTAIVAAMKDKDCRPVRRVIKNKLKVSTMETYRKNYTARLTKTGENGPPWKFDADGQIGADENGRAQLDEDKLQDMEMDMRCFWEKLVTFENLVRDAVSTTEKKVAST